MEDSKHEKGMEGEIAESESLIHGHRMGSNSPDKPEFSGSLAVRITKNADLRERTKVGNGFGNWRN